MDELDVLQSLRNEVPPATRPGLLRARAALMRELDEPRAAQVRPTRQAVRRIGWRMAAGVGLVAALTVALFATQGVRKPNELAGGRPGTPGVSAPNSNATQILRNAALVAEHQQILPARPDQYVFIESVGEGPGGERFDCDGEADQSHCAAIEGPTVRGISQVWLSVDGTRDGLVRDRPEQSKDKWNEFPLVFCPTGVKRVGADGKPVTTPCIPQPAYRADLPTDARTMLVYLQQKADEHPKKSSKRGGETYAFTVAGDLIRGGYLPPAALAAIFQASARIPGITVATDAVDAAGRHGISMGWQGHGVRVEMIFDATTYVYLGDRTIALQDVNGVKKGDIVGQTARLRLAIVDRAGQLP